MKRALVSVVVVAMLIAAALGYMGYFGGQVLVPVAATAPARPDERGLAAVFLSGDMGFRVGLGPPIAKRIAAHGIPVIGVNSLVYFRNERTPREASTLVDQAIDRALALPGISRVALIGQSFGADMLQQSLAGLSPARRARVIMVGLIVPGATLDFQATPGGLWSPATTRVPALPTARQIDWVPLTCIYGRGEDDSLCPRLTAPNVTPVALPGGHMLGFSAARVADAVIHAIDRTAALPNAHVPPTARP